MTEEMKYIVSACLLNDLNLEQISGHLHKEPVVVICSKEYGHYLMSLRSRLSALWII
jgi:hypothetical protein